MLTEQEKSQIRNTVQSPQWQTIERLAQLLINKIQSEPTIGDSEWDTLRRTVEQQGQVKGINRFIQEIYTQGK